MTVTPDTLTVAELLTRVESALSAAFPGVVWVRGEISGYRRTSRGAAFFRMADPSSDGQVVDVAARGRIMYDIERALDAAGVGALRDGIEVRIRATVGLDTARSMLRLSMLDVDPEFIAGRLGLDRAATLRKLTADGTLAANSRLPLPLVPLRVGLVTARGSAAHADFLHQLAASGYRFSVLTAHAAMQGESAPTQVAAALALLDARDVDVVALVRGGGAKLDLAAFDTETVGRAVGAMSVPVVTGIGHEVDDSVADAAAAVAVKTPTAAGEWLVARVGDFAARVDTARRLIADEARAAVRRAGGGLDQAAAVLGGVRGHLARQHDLLQHLNTSIASEARRSITTQTTRLDALAEVIGSLGPESALRRGFALVTDDSGAVVRSRENLSTGQRISLRFIDGTVTATVEETSD